MSTSIVDYASLQTSVANWLHRSDLTTYIPDFIAMAEAQAAIDLNCRWQWVTTTVNTTAASDIVAIPSDCLELKRLRCMGSPNQVLIYMSADILSTTYNDPSNNGQPINYTILGQEIQVGPLPDQVYPIEFWYKQRVPTLSSTNATNWLVTNFPNVYLWGSIIAASVWLKDDPRIQTIAQLYQNAVETINGIQWSKGSSLAMVPQ